MSTFDYLLQDFMNKIEQETRELEQDQRKKLETQAEAAVTFLKQRLPALASYFSEPHLDVSNLTVQVMVETDTFQIALVASLESDWTMPETLRGDDHLEIHMYDVDATHKKRRNLFVSDLCDHMVFWFMCEQLNPALVARYKAAHERVIGNTH